MSTTTTLQQTANKLGISITVLREYMAAKAAEVTPRVITATPQRQSSALALGK
jgi:hypothetical protein